MNKSRKVSIIAVYRNYYEDFVSTINSVLNQSYKNIELIILNMEEGIKKEDILSKLGNLALIHSDIKILDISDLDDDTAVHIAAAEKCDGDYLIFLNYGEILTKDFIKNGLSAIKNDNTIALSKISFYFPAETISDLYEYKNQLYSLKKNDMGFTFLQGSSEFWGYYCLSNKIISRSLWNKIEQKANAVISYKKGYGIGEDFLLSYLLWGQAVGIVSTDDYVILPWKNEDSTYKFNYSADVSGKIKSFCNAVTYVFKHYEQASKQYDRLLITRACQAYISRYLWRAGWAMDSSTVKSFKELLSDNLHIIDFERSAEAKKIEDDNKYVDLSSRLNLTQDIIGNYDGKIKIYVSMHKPSYVPDNKYLVPIQVGTALADKPFPGILHDNDGLNISEKNKRYCELTAQYWAWKNDKDADYYGFWHYRRYFSFNARVNAKAPDTIFIDDINNRTLKEFSIDEQTMSSVISNYDMIIPIEWACNEGNGSMTVLEHWRKHFSTDDITVTMQVISEKYPKFIKYMNETMLDTKALFCNMFIVNKKLFNEYSEFCFGVLEEVEKRTDHSKYNVERYRTLGHIGERLFDIFVRYARDTYPDIRILQLPRVQFKNTDNFATVKKLNADSKKYVAIALACDDKYMPYTGALLQSIIENTSSGYFYDIVIMHNSISVNNQRICTDLAKLKNNVSVRFADISKNFAEYAAVHVDRHLTVETYFRFLIPDLFKDYDKVLYLDCDMIVNDDLGKLFDIDLKDNYIAATRDIDFIASCEKPGTKDFYKENILKYIKIDAVDNYFQAGLILFNLKEINKYYNTAKLFEVALSRNWYYHDQDTLNHLFNGKVMYLDQRWNVLSLLESGSNRENLIKDYLYAKYNEAYYKARKNPAVIHFAGIPKPWKDLSTDFADYFWKYARNCPYYEKLLVISNEAAATPKGSVIIYAEGSDYNRRRGVPLFTIKCNANVWTSTYVEAEMVYLTDNNQPCQRNRLLVSSRVVLDGSHTKNYVSRFTFEDVEGSHIFKDHIGYTVNADMSITVWLKYINIFEGMAWRVLIADSRDVEKPSIIANNAQIVYNLEEIPANITYQGKYYDI